MHQTTAEPTTVFVIDVVAASFNVIAAAFIYHQCEARSKFSGGKKLSHTMNIAYTKLVRSHPSLLLFPLAVPSSSGQKKAK